jgi:hypothetical protein
MMGCGSAADDTSGQPTTSPAPDPVQPPVQLIADEEQPTTSGGGEEGAIADPWFMEEGVDAGSPSDAGTPSDAASGEAPIARAAGLTLFDETVRQLSAMTVTVYQHTTFVDEATGTYKYDCSGFLGYSLHRVLPTHLTAVKAFAGVTRPLAKHYEMFFASIAPGTAKSGWSRVVRPIDLQPGDVVAWLKPVDLVSTNTGHVMIVRAKPSVNPKRADEIIVPITDSSASFHGSTDTRYPSGEGLGRGPIGLIVDEAGAPIRYRWTGAVSTKEWATEISLGRPE